MVEIHPSKLKFVMRVAVIVAPTQDEALKKWEGIQSYKGVDGIQVQIGGAGLDLSKYDWNEDLSKADEAAQNFAKRQQEFHLGKTITRRLVANSFLDDNTFRDTPEEVADEIEDSVAGSDVDGSISPTSSSLNHLKI